MKRVKAEKYDHGYGRPFEIISQENVNLDGRVLKQSVNTEFDPKEYFAAYDARDFYLENILAVGATDGLKEVKLVNGRLMDMERIDKYVAEMGEAFDFINNNEVK